jgi:hypothetical protein
MRKQYNFWPGKTGLDAWDVDRLIELSKGLKIREISLDTIAEIDKPYWSFEGKPMTVHEVAEHAKLIQEVDISFPIILAASGRVMDGMHRIARAILDECRTIKAVQFSETPKPDYKNADPALLPY